MIVRYPYSSAKVLEGLSAIEGTAMGQQEASLLKQLVVAVGTGGVTPPPPFVGPLDDYTTSMVGAWSVARRLLASYSGSLIRVRRSSDSAELDIGYDTDGLLDAASLLAFVGAGDGFVTTIYYQSGSGSNFVQAVAANQPQIVASGSLIVNSGRPALLNSGTLLYDMTLTGAISAQTWITSGQVNTTNPTFGGLLTGGASTYVMIAAGGAMLPPSVPSASVYADGVDITGVGLPFADSNPHCWSVTGDTTSEAWIWGSDRHNASRYLDGFTHELILYSDVTANRAAVETVLMDFLGI